MCLLIYLVIDRTAIHYLVQIGRKQYVIKEDRKQEYPECAGMYRQRL